MMWKIAGPLVAAIVLLLAGGWGGYQYGVRYSTNAENKRLEREVVALKQANTLLEGKVVTVTRARAKLDSELKEALRNDDDTKSWWEGTIPPPARHYLIPPGYKPK